MYNISFLLSLIDGFEPGSINRAVTGVIAMSSKNWEQ